MKFSKILALALAVLMIACVFASCDKGGNTDSETTTAANGGEENPERVSIIVSIKVKDLSGKVVYDAPKYVYTGEQPNLVTLIEDYLYMEKDLELDYDGYTINAIGSVAAGDVTEQNGDETTSYTTYWWYKVNDREGSTALDEYQVKNGDVIEYYLKKAS